MSITSRTGGTPSAGDEPDVDDVVAAAPVAQADDDKLDSRVWKIAGVVVLGAIMSILDVTVVNVAIQHLATTFHTDLPTIQWISTGYTLALATVIPLTGWGADRFGTKRIYMFSIGFFVLGSVLSGLAWSAGSLIFFRVLQGFGGGMIMPAGMTILTRAAGPHRVGRVMAVIGVPMLLGPIFGPILGGWLVDDVSWRWIFFINLPIGIIALFASLRVLEPDVPEPGHRLDWVSLALLSPGLALLIYGFAESASKHGFGHVQVLGPMIVGAALVMAFIMHARGLPDALIDLKLYANRVFSAASITLALMIIAVFGGMLLVPLYFQNVRLENALQTGLLMAPQGLGAMIAMPIAGMLADKTGVGKIVPWGLATVGVSFVFLTQLEWNTSYWLIGGALFVMGVGMGFTMMPTFSGAMQTLRAASIARASTALNITQQVSASVGTAALSVILFRILIDKIPGYEKMASRAQSVDLKAMKAQVAQLSPAQKAQQFGPYAHAFGETFYWALGFVILAFVVATVLLPKKHVEAVDENGEPISAAAMMG